MKSKRWQVLLALLLWAFVAGCADVRDIDGHAQTPLRTVGKRGTVLLFYWHDCPICNSYASEINRIGERYTNFDFYIVQVDRDLTPAAARKHAHDFNFRAPVLLDYNHRLVKLAGATITPEAVVFGPNKNVLYRGRIDNLYADLNQRRAEATEHDLRDALDAISTGRPVKSQPPPVGCAIQ